MMRQIFAAIAMIQTVGVAHAQPVDLSDAPAYPDLYQPELGDGRTPRDLVLLGADLVEIAVALGAADRILARPHAVDLEGIEDTPNLLRERAGVEGVVALRPGVVVGSSVIYETLLAGLDDLGIETLMIDRSLPAVEKVERMAELLKVEDRGERLIAAIENDYATVEPVLADGEPLRILHASKQGAGGNFSAGGSGTAVHNLIERVGAQNAAAEIGMDRYRSVTPEGILTMAPDVVIISQAELDAFGDPQGLWDDYPGLALTPAGQNQRLIVMRELHVRADAASSGIAAAALSAALQDMFK
ncbi:ABC transporter substrate-binding protein [Paracoccus sp. TK19116]|uniref:ABC transporter substrate-binding protein n=1 Tax=Paracoccus albicereus TaxID=2922394 RepID=A0ABT1MYL0_9RHOB|nr:ABC transporter substrate-binding protein [Paracoccus albicereus]MCQ0971956.1 ABC transporter substrate-binding protein [Paracoccus albicereus]